MIMKLLLEETAIMDYFVLKIIHWHDINEIYDIAA